jgi:hypothetical protein
MHAHIYPHAVLISFCFLPPICSYRPFAHYRRYTAAFAEETLFYSTTRPPALAFTRILACFSSLPSHLITSHVTPPRLPRRLFTYLHVFLSYPLTLHTQPRLPRRVYSTTHSPRLRRRRRRRRLRQREIACGCERFRTRYVRV